ncbi:MAG: hypothetical protein HQL30_07305 [Candidatus Omnitrophica bacterium]|nr:hypothetical protein [Candidatus Omnitrophota bacterium]
MVKDGFEITFVEKRSDSFKKGIRPGYVITSINAKPVSGLAEKEIVDFLTPEINAKIILIVLVPLENIERTFEVVSEEYFKETVRETPTGVANIKCLKIEKFNKDTNTDLADYLKQYAGTNIPKMLIIDIRDNPGGPPLAVREIMGYFIGPDRNLCYYKKKNAPVFGLTSPKQNVYYGGPLALLINKKSGSASELMAGVLKEYKRAIVVGREDTAGMSFLKGTNKFDDDSMLVMITAMSYLFNGKEMGFKTVEPNFRIPADAKDELEFLVHEINK